MVEAEAFNAVELEELEEASGGWNKKYTLVEVNITAWRLRNMCQFSVSQPMIFASLVVLDVVFVVLAGPPGSDSKQHNKQQLEA